MTIGGRQDGGIDLILTPEEAARFKAGKLVAKTSGDSRGMFTVTAKITRPRSREKRYPEAVYGK